MKTLIAAGLSVLLALPALAADHDHEIRAGALTIVHPWAAAARAGGETLVYFELHNEGAPLALIGFETEIAASARLVGATMTGDGTKAHLPLDSFALPSGDFAFDPNGLGILLEGLVRDLNQGDDFELELELAGGQHVHLHVEVEAADATRHSHAGHSH